MSGIEDNPATPGRPVGTLRANQKEATRRRLMDAAMTVFAEKGYGAVTVNDIAREAGTSTATFYLHFKRKIDVLTESIEEEGRQVWFVSEPVFSTGQPLTLASLRAWSEQLFDYWQELRVSHQALGQAVLIEPELKVEQTRRLREGIEFWETFLERLGLAAGPARRAEAALLNAQIYGLFEMWIVHRIALDADALVEVTATSLWQRLSSLLPELPVARGGPKNENSID
jgi:AcrR family transcriptional regulator